jgi:hypothetical protein
MIYCAHYYVLGESYIVTADSPEALQVLIFGKAYAPSRASVTYWRESLKEGAGCGICNTR